jgi:hypothetical protein
MDEDQETNNHMVLVEDDKIEEVVAKSPDKVEADEEAEVVVEKRRLPGLKLGRGIFIKDTKTTPDDQKKRTPELLVPKEEGATPVDILNRPTICYTCKKEYSKYTCPRCNLPSCSLACYKAHNEKCTEKFYQESFMESLKTQTASEEDKKKMFEILKRVYTQSESDEESEDDEDLLSKLTRDNLRLEDLSQRQQEDFKRALIDGRLSALLPPWTPWWKHGGNRTATGSASTLEPLLFGKTIERKPKIQIISETEFNIEKGKGKGKEKEEEEAEDREGEEESEVEQVNRPEILSEIAPLSSLLKTNPSPLLANNLIDILYGYAFLMRYYNGEVEEEAALDAVHTLIQLSPVLGENRVHQSPSAAIQAVIANSRKPSIQNSAGFSLLVVDDVAALLSEQDLILMALSDLYRLIEKAITQTTKQRPPDIKTKKKLEPILKKVFFFLSWTKEQDEGLLWVLMNEIKRIYEENSRLAQANQDFPNPAMQRKLDLPKQG